MFVTFALHTRQFLLVGNDTHDEKHKHKCLQGINPRQIDAHHFESSDAVFMTLVLIYVKHRLWAC
jgi:hypothetical protein